MNMQMAVEKTIFPCPFLFCGPPQSAKSHMNHSGTAALPLEAAGRMFFDPARPHDLGVGANGNFPEIEEAWTWEAGVLCALAFLQQIAPGVTVGRATNDPCDLPPLQFDLDLREGAREMTRRPCHHT